MGGKCELLSGKPLQPNRLWAPGQPNPDPDHDSLSISLSPFYWWRGNADEEAVSRMNHSAFILWKKKKILKLQNYERVLNDTYNILLINHKAPAALSSLCSCAPWPLPSTVTPALPPRGCTTAQVRLCTWHCLQHCGSACFVGGHRRFVWSKQWP